MRINATCRHCGREFLFFQLYTAAPALADRCPHCSVHLGIPQVGPLAARADQAFTSLVDCLEEIAYRSPGFAVDTRSVLDPVRRMLPPEDEAGAG